LISWASWRIICRPAPCYIGNLDDQGRAFDVDRRHPAVDNTLIGVHLCRAQAHLVRVIVARLQHAAEYVAHFGLVVDQSQQRFSSCALQTDA
jgi:hypothetical protein